MLDFFQIIRNISRKKGMPLNQRPKDSQTFSQKRILTHYKSKVVGRNKIRLKNITVPFCDVYSEFQGPKSSIFDAIYLQDTYFVKHNGKEHVCFHTSDKFLKKKTLMSILDLHGWSNKI